MDSKSISTGQSQAYHSMKVKDPNEVSQGVSQDVQRKTISEKIEEKVENVQQEKYSRDYLDEQVDGMNKFLEASFTSLKYNVHEKLERLYVQIVDKETEEVIREVPPKEFLDMIASMLEHMGLIIDKKI